jgi:hypothetical protein
MNRNPFESSTSLFGALPFALLLLLGVIAVFGPRKLRAMQLAARDHSREWARANYPVIKRAAAKLPAQAQQWTREYYPVVKRTAARVPAHAQRWARGKYPILKRRAVRVPVQARQWARENYPLFRRRAADDFATLRHHIGRVGSSVRLRTREIRGSFKQSGETRDG